MSRTGDTVRIGDDVGHGQEPGRWAKLIDIKELAGEHPHPLYLFQLYLPGDADGAPTGELRQSVFIWPTEFS